MEIKKVKIVSFTLIITALTLIVCGVIPNVSNSTVNYYEFSRGMLAGIGSVASVVWLIFLIFAVNSYGNKKGIISFILKNNQILSSIGLFCLFSAAFIATWFWNSFFLTVTGITAAGISIVLHKSFLRKAKGKIC